MKKNHKNKPLHFILLLGIISLFSDTVYEGARSIAGPYLGSLGASGAVIGFVFGFGEFIGYVLRLVTGRIVDKTARYWLLAYIGYLCNIIAIPLLAITNHWPLAVLLFIIEKIGKAIRTPARDAMLSYASTKMGRGWGFGIHQMLDQMGGILGPLIITLTLFFKHSYQLAFAILAIPALMTLSSLLFAKKLYPAPQHFEVELTPFQTKNLPSRFWLFLIISSLLAAGYADYPLIAFHFHKDSIVKPIWIPIFYMFAMGTSALSAIFFGWLYDKKGTSILLLSSLFSSLFAPFVFLGDFKTALFGMILWGFGIGAQRSLFKAIVGDMVPKRIRGSAYGIFNTGYGIAWFLGSWLIGVLYDVSIPGLIWFSILIQLSTLPLIFILQKKV